MDQTGIKFSDAIRFIKPYKGDKNKCHLFIKDCERAFKRIRTVDKDALFDYILSQLEGVESEIIGNRQFKNWEELSKFLNGNYMKLNNVNLVTEIAKFSTLKQGNTEDAQAYFDRAYQMKRRIDAILEKPEHNHAPLINQAKIELIRGFVYGLHNPQFRFTLSQELPDSLEDVLDKIEKWEKIPGCGTPSQFSHPIRALDKIKMGCLICKTNSHVMKNCLIAREAMGLAYIPPQQDQVNNPRINCVYPEVERRSFVGSTFDFRTSCPVCQTTAHKLADCATVGEHLDMQAKKRIKINKNKFNANPANPDKINFVPNGKKEFSSRFYNNRSPIVQQSSTKVGLKINELPSTEPGDKRSSFVPRINSNMPKYKHKSKEKAEHTSEFEKKKNSTNLKRNLGYNEHPISDLELLLGLKTSPILMSMVMERIHASKRGKG